MKLKLLSIRHLQQLNQIRGILLDKNLRGSISIFLAFIIVLILALVGTTLEGNRLLYAKAFTKQSLSLAVDSLLTKFYLPLYQEYHVFFLDTGLYNQEEERNEIESQIKENMSYILNSQTSISTQSVNLTQVNIEEVTASYKLLIDNQSIFLEQALLYMSQKDEDKAGKEIEFKQIVKDIKDQNVNYEIISNKLKIEQSIAEVYQPVLKIIQLVEGIDCSKNGFRYHKNGKLRVIKSFVKKICIGKVNQTNVFVKPNKIWKALEHSYIDIIKEYQDIQDVVKETIIGSKDHALNDESQQIIVECNKKQKELNVNILKGKKQLEEVLNVMKELENKNQKIESEIIEHEKMIKGFQGEVKDSTYQNILSDAQALKEYHNRYIIKILQMRPIIEQNLAVLNNISLSECDMLSVNQEKLESYNQEIEKNKSIIKDYNIKDLVFDYGILAYQGKTEDPSENLKELVKNPIYSILTEDKISNHVIDNFNDSNTTKNGSLEWKNIIDTGLPILQNIVNHTSNIEKQFSDNYRFYQYLLEHFNLFTNQSFTSHSLNYELEYMLKKKNNDKDNITSIINDLLALRTMFNFIYLLGDQIRSEQAYGLATVLVGCTGLEPFIRVAKTFLCLIWAYEEAMVDVSGLLNNKRIPIMKTSNTFQVTYQDLFIMNKALIKKKVQGLANEDQNTQGLSYQDYLQIFFLFQNQDAVIRSALTLIESNLVKVYDPSFSIKRCIYSIKADAKFHIPPKFLYLPFVSDKVLGYEKGWNLYSSIECSY